eukprot:CAMPEP_0194110926 /NCGR_PEP_ID=MMETSP0150-20130528/10060_1 /TAXON_ID=122233 /ORGANISM="Chaetoceros debilis, Strain MM31A-1" /LENGTH=328 /DNA_ID=CAMNT_0038800225 /DNA_START=241 /DNA_END=1227 /DNA_ORIENTATION=-
MFLKKRNNGMLLHAASIFLAILSGLESVEGKSLVVDMDACVSSLQSYVNTKGGTDRARIEIEEYKSLITYYGGELDTAAAAQAHKKLASETCDHFFGENNPDASGNECDDMNIPFFSGARNVMENVYLYIVCKSVIVPPSITSSRSPSSFPSIAPAPVVATPFPSRSPSSYPSVDPSVAPVEVFPSLSPRPSSQPSSKPSASPTISIEPSSLPTNLPTQSPSVSALPSNIPSVSYAPSELPSSSPTVKPPSITILIVAATATGMAGAFIGVYAFGLVPQICSPARRRRGRNRKKEAGIPMEIPMEDEDIEELSDDGSIEALPLNDLSS